MTPWRGTTSPRTRDLARLSRLSYTSHRSCECSRTRIWNYALNVNSPPDFWHGVPISTNDVRLYNKRVFITSDLGDSVLPKWMSWIKVSFPIALL
jgi:hypothetical protein